MVLCPSPAHSADILDEVVLQLPWIHQFQFAGYYAAVEQGYYQDAGLNVTLKSGILGQDVMDEVLSGRADYGVARSEILLRYLNGDPLVALAAIFQHSAAAILVRQDSGIRTPQDLVGHTAMMKAGDAEYLALLKKEGVGLDQLEIIPISFDIQDLIRGETEAYNAYISNEPFYLEEKGVPYTLIKPTEYGIDFYGDTLFTSDRELKARPDLVGAFREASIKGWEYALSHHEEIIELLLTKYKVDKSKALLRFEADTISGLIMPELLEVGHMHPDRWQYMADTFYELGMVGANSSIESFIYSPPPEVDLVLIRKMAFFLTMGFGSVFLVSLLYFNRKLNLSLADRTRQVKHGARLFKEIFNNINNGVVIYKAVNKGKDFIIKDINPAGLRFYSVARGDVINKSVKKVFPGVVDMGLFDIFQRVWKTGTPEHQQPSLYKDGRTETWVENYVCKLPSGEIIAFGDDITERQEAKKREEHLKKRLEALWKISSMLDFDMDSICNAILEELVALTDSNLGFHCFMDDDGEIEKIFTFSGDKPEICDGKETVTEFTSAATDVLHKVVNGSGPFISNDFSNFCREKGLLFARQMQVDQILAVPVMLVGQIVAVAVVAGREQDYSADDLSQVEDFLLGSQVLLDRKRTELANIQAKEE